jgi:hypothetical protein
MVITHSNMTSFFRFVNKRAIYRLCVISLAHAQVHMTDFPVVNVHVDELSANPCSNSKHILDSMIYLLITQ